MPRAKRSRRFNDPQCGVSRAMIESEAKAVGREMGSYLRLSLAENKKTMANRLRSYGEADASLHDAVQSLPEREQVAVKCLIARDLYFVVELYLEYLRASAPESTVPIALVQSPPSPFSEWLFGG